MVVGLEFTVCDCYLCFRSFRYGGLKQGLEHGLCGSRQDPGSCCNHISGKELDDNHSEMRDDYNGEYIPDDQLE